MNKVKAKIKELRHAEEQKDTPGKQP